MRLSIRIGHAKETTPHTSLIFNFQIGFYSSIFEYIFFNNL